MVQLWIVFRTLILALINVLALVGNFLVCFTLYRRQFLLTPSNKLVFSLTCSNLAFSTFVLPFAVASSFLQKWPLGSLWCSVAGYFSLTIFSSSMFTLSAISYDRYCAIVHPLKYPSRITSYRATFIIILCWLVSGSCSLPPLFGTWSSYEFTIAKLSCLPAWSSNHGFSMFWLILCCLLPYCVMIGCYCRIFYVAQKKASGIGISQQIIDSQINILECDDETHVKPGITSSDVHKIPPHVPGAFAVNVALSNMEDSGIVTSFITKDVEQLPHPNQVLENAAEINMQEMNTNRHDEVLKDPPINDSLNNNTDIIKDAHLSASLIPGSSHKSSSDHQEPATSASHQDNSSAFFNNKIGSINETVESKSYRNKESFRNRQEAWQRSIDTTTSNNTHGGSSFTHHTTSARKSLLFNYSHYYANQRKTLCTIFFVVGVLLFTIGPFIVTSLLETFLPVKYINDTSLTTNQSSLKHETSIPEWWLSVVACLMYLNCAHYPVIYGAWNRTVRKEMKSLIFGTSRGPKTKRTRILSLSTHFKDLGLSPRLTAAIMEESAAVATIVRPMQIERKTSVKNKKKWLRTKKEVNCTKSNVSEVKSEDCLTFQNQNTTSLVVPSIRTTNNENNNSNQLREREKLGSNPIQINRSEITDNEILSSFLLFSPPELGPGVQYKGCERENKNSALSNNQIFATENMPDRMATDSRASSPYVSDNDAATINLSSDEEEGIELQNMAIEKQDLDQNMGLRKRELHQNIASKKLIHLKPDGPIRIKRWKKPQMVDYFAQTMAYDLLEDVRK
uniref:uncharacterized protein LOC100176943 isoform X2 n=1 Tax=Ciona intestinalis TaxID=7719 RepID=UPI00089DB28E|nr:uncharacterized protein LOC100176943 isoform X2 [Ciona intestinalis]|eukprot:XP_018671470.1 uncharacterized protein LOC100176943 isoform X2 [Ciona intestinalis]